MTELIDRRYFLELAVADPKILCRNERCRYLADQNQYHLELWGDRYCLDVASCTIEYTAVTGPLPHPYFELLAIYYLFRTQDIVLVGDWFSEKDLPGGSIFFRGPHKIPTELIVNRFKNDLQEFKKQCLRFGGKPVNMADAAFCFSIAPDISVVVLYWLGDEDFPAEAKILYDQSIIGLLSLDIVFALAVGVCSRIGTAD